MEHTYKYGLKFGVFTDSHYSTRENETQRYFQKSLGKIKNCITEFSKHDVDFIVCLGDIIDWLFPA